ncbi:MAG: cellulose biosynthesis cyclic di-GMP-binding regulatory protein BcsB, partial [Thermodesulfobacteriota bacterium]
LEPGYNDLTFAVSQHYTLECEHPCAPELWTTLELDEAFIEMEYELKPVPLRLSSVSDYLFDPKIFPRGEVNIITEEMNSDFVSVASTVASGIALRFDYRNAVFSLSSELKQNRDNILIGTKGFVESFLNSTDLKVEGPFLKIAHLPVKESPTSTTEKEKAESNKGHAVVIVSGKNLDEVRLAARALAVISYPFPNTDAMEVKEISLPEVYPYTGRSILSPGSEYSFKTLSLANHTFKGMVSENRELSFRLPTDLLIEPNLFAELSLHLVYGAGMRSDSALNILLNGENISAIHLDNPNGAVYSDYKVPIPTYLFRRGNNVISFQAVLTPSITGHCELIQTENLFLSLFDDSSFRFPDMPHWVDLPRMELFFEDGFPFTRWPDGRETAFYIAQSDFKTVGAALNLIGLMSQKIGYPLFKINIGFDKPDNWKGDIIVLGQTKSIPEDLQTRAPLKLVSPTIASYPLLQNLNKEKVGSKWEQLKNAFLDQSQSIVSAAPPADTAFSDQTGSLGSDRGALMGFQSPYESGRTVLLVTASSEDDLEKTSRAILNPSVQGKSRGDIALVALDSRDYAVSSLQVGERYYSGKLGKGDKLKSYIGAHSWFLFLSVGLSVIFMTLTIYYLLKKQRQRRLGGA